MLWTKKYVIDNLNFSSLLEIRMPPISDVSLDLITRLCTTLKINTLLETLRFKIKSTLDPDKKTLLEDLRLYNPILNINLISEMSVRDRVNASYKEFQKLKHENPVDVVKIQTLAQQIYRIQSHRKYDKDIYSDMVEEVMKSLPIISSEGKIPTDLEKLLATFFKKSKKVKKSKTPKKSKSY